MKKAIKITLVGLASLLVVVAIVIAVLSWIIFTPSKLTPIVSKQMDKVLVCEHEIGDVELIFFSTFPQFGLQINGLTLINPLPGAPSDTLISSPKVIASLDLKTLWKKNELLIDKVDIKQARILVFTDSLGNTNYDIMLPDDTPDTTAFELPFEFLQIEKISLKNAAVVYHDTPMDMVIKAEGLHAEATMDWQAQFISGKLNADAEKFSFYWDESDYLKEAILALQTPFSFDLDNAKLSLTDADLCVNHMDFDLDAMIQSVAAEDAMLLDIAFQSSQLLLTDVMDLMSLPFGEYMEGITAEGKTFIGGSLKGSIADSLLPLFTLQAKFHEVDFEYESLDHKLYNMSGIADIVMDLNKEEDWYVKVTDFDAKTKLSHLAGSALVDQLADDMRFDIRAKVNLDLVDAKPFLPDDMPLDIKGKAIGTANIKFLYSQFEQDQFDKMLINGKVKLKDFVADYDSIVLRSNLADLAFEMPNKQSKKNDFIALDIATHQLDVAMNQDITAVFNDIALLLATNNLLVDNLPLSLEGSFNTLGATAFMDDMAADLKSAKGIFDFEMDTQDSTAIPQVDFALEAQELMADIDTIHVDVQDALAKVVYRPDAENQQIPYLEFEYHSENLAARLGKSDQVTTDNISLNAGLTYDETQEKLVLQWTPKGYVKLKNALIDMAQVGTEISIPEIDFDFTPDELLIYDSRLVIDQSDFQLTGQLKNIRPYFKDEALLTGDFNFRSHTTDVNQLMAMFNGLGYEKTELLTEEEIVPEESYSGPFMVPKGVDIALYTSINQALYANDTARNVEGTVTVKDGTLVLESMLFTTSAAKMQLTAMYKSPRKNHLYAGVDLHLLEIEIAELLDLIPDVDSIMPMLRSFAGKGEFHIAIETYLDSAYNLKPSTLRGASSVRGIDLVLMDGETFTEIAKTLRFNKKTENKIDSLSAEFTVFREEVDVYPFLIVMDQYKAIVEGRHHLDMNFNYHISLIDNPLHLRLGVDVNGNLDKMKIRPVKCKYANMYRPAYRNEVDIKKLELRELIRRELVARIREE